MRRAASAIAGFLNGGLVGGLAGAAGAPLWGCILFGALSCAIMCTGVLFAVSPL